MLYKGHLAAGAVVASATAIAVSYTAHIDLEDTLLLTTCSFATSFATSLLPDLDSKTSRISKKLPIMPFIKLAALILIFMRLIAIKEIFTDFSLSNIKNVYFDLLYISFIVFVLCSFGHRQIMHSLWLLAGAYIVVKRFIGFGDPFSAGISIGLISGIGSHLLGDMHTTDGCPLLYPLPINFRLAKYKSGDDDKKILLCIVLETIAVAGILIFKDKIIDVLKIFKARIVEIFMNVKQKMYAKIKQWI